MSGSRAGARTTGPTFEATAVTVDRFAAAPSLTLRLHVTDPNPVHAMALRCQVRIDPQRRAYSDEEAAALADLFGSRQRWAHTLRPFLWMHTSTVVPGFTDRADVDLPLALSYDMEVAAGKYFHAVRDGGIPLSLLLSGTVFYHAPNGFRVTPIAWNTDVAFTLPASAWREAMDTFFPGAGWIMLPAESLDDLLRVRSELGLTDWAQTITVLLDKAGVSRP